MPITRNVHVISVYRKTLPTVRTSTEIIFKVLLTLLSFYVAFFNIHSLSI